jgi:putative sugar O-methyltransferase
MSALPARNDAAKRARQLAKQVRQHAREARRLAKAGDAAESPTPAPSFNGLRPDQLALLERMRADNLASASPFRASEYWQGLNLRFDAWFREHGIADVEDQPYNRLFSGADPKSSKFYEYALWMLYERVRARDADGVLARVAATARGPKRGAIEFDGRPVSWDSLISVDTLLSLNETLGGGLWSEPVVVADLGAGWGRIGHALLSINPRAAYVAIDLPEALLVASEYLPRLLPGAAVRDYAAGRDGAVTRDDLAGSRLSFLGTHDLPRFAPASVDCLVNVASFQEMTRRQVGQYLAIADRIAGRAVYVQEIWDARRRNLDLAIAGIDEYDFPDRWERAFLRNATFSEKVFEAGFRL